MAAVRLPLSAFSPPYSDPSSPARCGKRASTDSTARLVPLPQRSPRAASPTENANPSPMATSFSGTDFDESAADEGGEPDGDKNGGGHGQRRSSLQVATKDEQGNDFRRPASREEDHPSSVIHAPQGFLSFESRGPASNIGRKTPTPSQRSEIAIISSQENRIERTSIVSPISPPPISTNIPLIHDFFKTPRAQTRQEAEALEKERAVKARSNSLEGMILDIPENQDCEDQSEDERRDLLFQTAAHQMQQQAEEIVALKMALSECWTLCNTLAGLSSLHRERAFWIKGKPDGREQAWKACWQLCQKLYDTRDDDDHAAQVGSTLDMCRDFCQSLFDVRQKWDDVSDSVLRVSFELNNHLYNTHDRALPEAFRERTLDFYITLCHRLMKQRNKMINETDALLCACWSLAEMLFSLRQNKREGRAADEELLGSAVQACWELCDLFREGWTQVRPDRGTPRPSSAPFGLNAGQQRKASLIAPTILIAESDDESDNDGEDNDAGRPTPETPTTVFEDANHMSPDEASVPNILVLGPDPTDRLSDWSSVASSRSGYSDSTASSSSTIINPTATDNELRLECIKLLIVRAAMAIGFDRATDALQTFVKAAPSSSFGKEAWHVVLLADYKKLVANDAAFTTVGEERRASARDIARSVRWMVGTGRYRWLRELYRWVLGFRLEEGRERGGVWIQA